MNVILGLARVRLSGGVTLPYDVLEGLNEEQQEAVTTTEGYVRVIAGAGSGKTRALTNRYVYLVNELGISTANILCVTFTNKASNEMKRRIRTMIGDYDTGYVNTFHGFCVQILREDIHTMNYPTNFVVMDTEDTEAILKTVYKEAKVDSKSYTFTMAKDMISMRKTGKSEQIPYILNMDHTELKKKYLHSKTVADRIFYGYVYEQKKFFGLDFDDLITFAVYILEKYEEKRDKWQKRLEYVMVDEFQDVSALQYKLADILSGYHKNLFVVGDPDQTIYTWRGARVEYILNFDQHHEGTKTIIMDKNYRSTPNILNASNSLITKNEKRIEKSLKPVRTLEIPVVYHHAKTVSDEAGFVVNTIQKIVESGKKNQDITILYRSHFVSRSLEEAFVKEKIPYVLYSGVEFYKRKEIKDILSYLRMLVNGDDLSFLRVINEPRRNFGNKRLELIKEYTDQHGGSYYEALKALKDDPLIAKSKAHEFIALIERYRQEYERMTLTELLTGMLNDSGYEAMLRQSGEDDRLDNIAELKQSVFEYEKAAGEETFLSDYLQNVSLFTNADSESRKNSVKLMTIHTAKGLEFPYVIVCGMNEGIFPSKHVNTMDRLEEERRLAYVAYTRAENALYLTESEGNNFDGSFRYPSRFIFNTDKEYLSYTMELEDRLYECATNYIELNERKIRLKEQMQETIDPEVLYGTKSADEAAKKNEDSKDSNDSKVFRVGDFVVHKHFGVGEVVEVNLTESCYQIKFEKLGTTRSMNLMAPLQRIVM